MSIKFTKEMVAELRKIRNECKKTLNVAEDKELDLEMAHRLAQMDAKDAAMNAEKLRAVALEAKEIFEEQDAMTANERNKSKKFAAKGASATDDADRAQRECTEAEKISTAAANELSDKEKTFETAKAAHDDQMAKVEATKQALSTATGLYSHASTQYLAALYDQRDISSTGGSSRVERGRAILVNRHALASTARGHEQRTQADRVPGSTQTDSSESQEYVHRSRGKDPKILDQSPRVYPTGRADSAGRGRSGTEGDKIRRSMSRSDSIKASTVKADPRANAQSVGDSELEAITKAVRATSATPEQKLEWKEQHKKKQALVEYSSVWKETRKQSWELVAQLGSKDREDIVNVRALKKHQIKRLDTSVKMWERQDMIEKRYAEILKALGPHPNPQASKQWLAPIVARQLHQLAKSIKSDEDCFSGKVGYDRKNVVSLKKHSKEAREVRDLYEATTGVKKTAQQAAMDVDFMARVTADVDEMESTLEDCKAACNVSEEAQKAAQRARQACVDRQAEFQKAFGVSVKSFVPDDEH